MDTASLIAALSDDPAPTRPAAIAPWLLAALALGALVALLNMIVWLVASVAIFCFATWRLYAYPCDSPLTVALIGYASTIGHFATFVLFS